MLQIVTACLLLHAGAPLEGGHISDDPALHHLPPPVALHA